MVPGALAFVVGGVLLAGCAVDSGDDENVAEAEGEFSEATCGTTATADATRTVSLFCGSAVFADSPNGNYDHADCSHGFIVDMSNNWPAASKGGAQWIDTLPTTSSDCTGSHVQLRVYDSSGNFVASASTSGTWNGSSCTIPNAYAATNFPNFGRVVAQAYTKSCFTCSNVYKKVRAGVWSTC